MTTYMPQRDPTSPTCIARVRATPTGEVKLVPGDADVSAYGPVEIAWFPDHLEITALGAGRATVTEGYSSGLDDNVVVEIRPPGPDETMDVMPGCRLTRASLASKVEGRALAPAPPAR